MFGEKGDIARLLAWKETLTDEERKAGKSLIEKRKELVQEQNLGGHLYEDGKEDCENYRYRRSNIDLRDKIVSIRQSRAQEQIRGVKGFCKIRSGEVNTCVWFRLMKRICD